MPRNERDLPPTREDKLRAELSDWKAIAAGLARQLQQFLDAYDKGAVEINSPEIGGEDDIPLHPWHEEWLHHARYAIAAYEKKVQNDETNS